MERLTNKKLKTLCDGSFVYFGSDEERVKYRMLAESAPKYEEIYKKLADYEDAEEQCIKECGCGLNMVMHKYKEFLEHMHELAEYWELEEQGLLLRLPCKVGDTIYVIPSWANYRLNKSFGHSENNRVYPQIVHSVQMWSKDRYSLTTCDGLRSEVSDFYKETWFLTKEEAEQALAEMGGET